MNNMKRRVLLVCCLLCVVFYTLFLYKKEKDIDNTEVVSSDYHTLEYLGEDYRFNSNIVSIVFIGIDRTGELEYNGQADAIQLVLLNRKEKTIKCLSIPRDTMTEIKFYDAEQKLIGWTEDHLSIAFAQGKSYKQGSRYICDALTRLFNNIPINYYCGFDLTQLEKIHSIVGELDVVVPNNSLESLGKDWKKGKSITITKDNVETFVRNRDIEKDFSAADRLERQQSYLEAYLEKFKSDMNANEGASLSKLEDVYDSITTNIGLSDMLEYCEMLQSYSFDETKGMNIIPGNNVKGIEYDEYHIDIDEFQKTLVELFYYRKKG